MTYCVGMLLGGGLVMMSDTRSNAGVDNISQVHKTKSWCVPGERSIFLLSAGNLATTQAVGSILDERRNAPEDRDPEILSLPSMFETARFIGKVLREVIDETPKMDRKNGGFSGTLILGGQIKGGPPRLFLIYPEGNFIEARDDTPFLQSGEVKYGRPILLRGYDPLMSFEHAVKLLLLSYDSTLRANLSVGMPLDLTVYRGGALDGGIRRRFEADDPYFTVISSGWSDALKAAVDSLPDFSFD